jgi:hypothetical protein
MSKKGGWLETVEDAWEDRVLSRWLWHGPFQFRAKRGPDYQPPFLPNSELVTENTTLGSLALFAPESYFYSIH